MAELLCLYSLQALQWNLDKPKRTMRFFFHQGLGILFSPLGTINLIVTVDPKVNEFSHNFPQQGINKPLSVAQEKTTGDDTVVLS